MDCADHILRIAITHAMKWRSCGDKAGVAAATLTDMNRWQEDTISDKLFLAGCSPSPPDAFRDAAKHRFDSHRAPAIPPRTTSLHFLHIARVRRRT